MTNSILRISRPTLAAAALGAALTGSAMAEDFFYRVGAAELGCILAHLDAYLSAGADPVLVAPGQCPPQGETSVAGLLTNEAPDLTFSEEGEVDPLLVLSPAQLRCLAEVEVPSGQGVMRLYPDLCRIAAD
jgi:hypothetical protein